MGPYLPYESQFETYAKIIYQSTKKKVLYTCHTAIGKNVKTPIYIVRISIKYRHSVYGLSLSLFICWGPT